MPSNSSSFQLSCIGCKNPVSFTLFDLDTSEKLVHCKECGKKYGFGEEKLKRQLKKFASLCKQIQESEEILGSAAINVAVGKDEISVPFKLLLTRLRSTLDLQVGGERLVISFRFEPISIA